MFGGAYLVLTTRRLRYDKDLKLSTRSLLLVEVFMR